MNETRKDIPKPKVSVVVLTYNEEANLPACLDSLTGVDSEIFVVDSGSTDRTKEIAIAAGAEVIEHPFETHTQQWNWALKNVPLQSEWVLGLDADQRLTPELQNEVTQLVSKENRLLQAIDGFYIKRRQVFRGRWIRHGGYYPKYLLKLFRRDKVRLDHNDLMDHHFYVDGAVAKLQHDLIEANKKEDDISFWIDKHNRYASLVAREEFHRRQTDAAQSLEPSLIGNPDQRTLWLKQIWMKLPLYVRPFIYFFYRYFLRLGFLDGKEGFIFHFLQGFWFRLLVDIKIDELRRDKRSDIREPGSEIGSHKVAETEKLMAKR